MSQSQNNNNNNNNNAGPSGSSQLGGPVEQVQQRRREAEERRMQEDEELAAKLAPKAGKSRRRERLDEAEKKWRETEKAKGNKRKADEEEKFDKGSVKKRKEVSNKFYFL